MPESPAQLYFAFPDGVFHHVCAECTKICCRHGSGCNGNARREMPALLSRFPAMALNVTHREGDVLSFHIPSGGCTLLDADGLCSAQRQLSKAFKPEGCVLFPFNLLTRIGPYVAVAPNFMCPLRMEVPPRPGEVEGTHARLKPGLESSASLQRLCTLTANARWTHLNEPPTATVHREELFRDRCSMALGKKRFIDTLQNTDADGTAFQASLERAARFLQIPCDRPAKCDAVDDLMHALAPTLRLGTLFLDPSTRCVAIGLAELVLRHTQTLPSSPLTVQGAHGILSAAGPALRLVARGDAPLPRIRGPINKGLPMFLNGDMTIAAYKVLLGIGTEKSTLDVLEDAMQRLSWPGDRMALLTGVSQMLEGRLAARGQGVSRRRPRK